MLEDSKVVTVIPAYDPMRARKFYHEILGIPIEQEFNTSTLYVTTAGSKIYTYKSEHIAKHTAASFTVPNIKQLVKQLKAKGVKFEEYPDMGTAQDGIYDMGDSSVAWFKDSEGNTLEISQIKK